MLLCSWADTRNWDLVFYRSAYNLTTFIVTHMTNYPLFTLTYSSVYSHTTFLPTCHLKWLCQVSVFSHCLRGRPVIRQSTRVTWWLYTFLNRLFHLHQRFSSLSRPDCDERLGSTPYTVLPLETSAIARMKSVCQSTWTVLSFGNNPKKKKRKSPLSPSFTLYTACCRDHLLL